MAIEVKISNEVKKEDLKGLLVFQETYKPKQTFLVNTSPKKRKIKGVEGHDIEVLPWRDFLELLWSGKIV